MIRRTPRVGQPVRVEIRRQLLREITRTVISEQPRPMGDMDVIDIGGRLAVIDFPPLPGWACWASCPEGVPEDRGGHGVTVEMVVAELRTAGFTLAREIGDWGSSSDYCLVFRKQGRTDASDYQRFQLRTSQAAARPDRESPRRGLAGPDQDGPTWAWPRGSPRP